MKQCHWKISTLIFYKNKKTTFNHTKTQIEIILSLDRNNPKPLEKALEKNNPKPLEKALEKNNPKPLEKALEK
jgi:hypothetical protein